MKKGLDIGLIATIWRECLPSNWDSISEQWKPEVDFGEMMHWASVHFAGAW